MSNEYITTTELAAGPYNLEVDDDDKSIGVLQDLTKTIIDNLCGQVFSKEGTTSAYVEKKISGTGKDTIFLPKRLITLEKIRIYSSSTGYVDYLPTNFETKAKFISWNLFTPASESARFIQEAFPVGSYNIGIFGIWGYATPPEPIKYLQARLIQKILKDNQFAETMESEKIGNYSGKLLVDAKGMITGNYEFDNIIRQYSSWVGYGIG